MQRIVKKLMSQAVRHLIPERRADQWRQSVLTYGGL